MTTINLTPQQIEDMIYRGVKRALSLKRAAWVSKDEAMQLLNCKDSTLSKIVNEGRIISNDQGKGKRNIQYNLKSIEKYLINKRIC